MQRGRTLGTVGAAVVLLAGLAAPTTAAAGTAGTAGTNRAGAAEPCTTYGEVVKAPKGAIPRDDRIQVRADPVQEWAEDNPALAGAASGATITVAFHVVAKRPGGAGDLTDEQLQAQVDVLNAAYGGTTEVTHTGDGGDDDAGPSETGFRFVLGEVDRSYKRSWFNLLPANGDERRLFRGSGKEVKLKQAFASRDPQVLDVYTASLGQFLLGWAYLPWDFTGVNGEPLPRFYDGVVIDWRSVPGPDAFAVYGEGDTLTHEVGHWLGLFHTFDGGCSEENDYVADTPAEAAPAFRCPEGRDTCAAEGLDPIHNFMDYTYDGCMYEFTDGQGLRMRQAWSAFRAS